MKFVQEECYSLSIKDLRIAGLLSYPDTRTFTYSDLFKVKVESFINQSEAFILVKVNTLFIDQEIKLYKMKSNLSGYYFYFICPSTGAKCSKLFLPKGYYKFQSRKAYSMVYYQQQRSKKKRKITSLARHEKKLNDLILLLSKKSSKLVYKGKSTKKLIRLLSLFTSYKKLSVEGIGCESF